MKSVQYGAPPRRGTDLGTPTAQPAGTGTAFGTFGELLQGALPEKDGDFLVTLPVARWAMAAFRPRPASAGLTVLPARKEKARRLARMILDDTPWPVGGLLTLTGGIPEGKGLASSSADLVATARAMGSALGITMPSRRIEQYLARIEPTDGVLYPAVVAYHHRSVRLRSVLGSLPAMTVVGLDEGGTVDTVAYNRIAKSYAPSERREYALLLERLTAAVRRCDLGTVGEVATRSALMNQRLRPKRSLDAVREICREVGGLGVVAGHSGTTLGVLLDTRDPAFTHRVTDSAQACAELPGCVTIHRTLSFSEASGPVRVGGVA